MSNYDSGPKQAKAPSLYRGRLAPTPSGRLHLGHGRTFWLAALRARAHHGELFLRIEDVDQARCSSKFEKLILEDLHDLGLLWETPIVRQSERFAKYREAAGQLAAGGFIYPSNHSRAEIRSLATSHERGDRQPLFPTDLRPSRTPTEFDPSRPWRFRVPDGEEVSFHDQIVGPRSYLAGTDFGDFLVWSRHGWPSYELAVVVDDLDMRISEVVRGADLLKSTARQSLIYSALGSAPPDFAHCPLICDPEGNKLSKSFGSPPLLGSTPPIELRNEALRLYRNLFSTTPEERAFR
ncbi:MAG: glutamate--tRNA ligase family protein [Puniceicoccaceae bacterium]